MVLMVTDGSCHTSLLGLLQSAVVPEVERVHEKCDYREPYEVWI
jgi:hypothetical protein